MVSIEQFGKALTASGVMTTDDLRAAWGGIPPEQRPKDGESLAKQLVAQKKLTGFQAAELLAGRGARLSMGEYLLLAEIGAGGMGAVYKAQHRRMKRIVALKVMSGAAMKDEAAVKRFQREVQAAAKLEHPNIVTAYDSGESGNVKYLVMQFVDGGDLSDLVKKNGPCAVERAVDYVVQAAKGLAFAHSEGVIHRDIKPANLLLDKKGTVKILDMGLARIEGGDDGLTATEQVMGTVDYMSPEQAANTKQADSRSDIYSLGCTLWYLLTAKKAYESDSLIGRLMAHRDAPLPSLVKSRDDVPWPLEQAFHKLIAKRPQDRFQTMDEVIAALEPFAGGGSSSGSSRSGSGSSGGTNAELASFMQSMGNSPTKVGSATSQSQPLAATGSKTSIGANLDATEQFAKAELDTDPKSAIAVPAVSSTARGATATKAVPAAKPNAGSKKSLLLAGAACLSLVGAGGIFMAFRGGGEEPAAAQKLAPQATAVPPRVAALPRATPVATRTPVSAAALDSSPTPRGTTTSPAAERIVEAGRTSLFNGIDLTGWTGKPGVWKWEAGELVGTLAGKDVTYLAGSKTYRDFELSYEVKFEGAQANSGVQFRSSLYDSAPFSMTGPQVEIGRDGKTGYAGLWWQSGPRNGVLSAVPTEIYDKLLKPDDYNRTTLRSVGKRVTITLNGTTTVDGDFDLPADGLLGWQLVSPGALSTVRFRNIVFRDLSNGAESTGATRGPTLDLLAAIQIPRDVVAGDWKKQGSALVTPRDGGSENQAHLYLPTTGPVPAEYDVEVVVERTTNTGTGLVLGFIMGGRQATAHFDSYSGPARWGIEQIDDENMRFDKNPTRNNGLRLTLNERKTIRVEVRVGGVKVFCDAERVVDWQGRPEQLSTKFWNVANKQSLFLGSQTVFHIHSIRLTSVGK